MAIASHTATLGLMHPLGTARTRKLQISRSKAEAFVPAGDSTYAPEGTYSPIRKVGYFDCTVGSSKGDDYSGQATTPHYG
jgi:hypothetical protein